MKRWELLLNKFADSRKSWDSVFLKNLELTNTDQVTSNPYKKSALVFTCIHTTAKAISQIPLAVYSKIGKVWKPLDDQHPWSQLFLRPNYIMDRYTYIEALVSYLMLHGNVWSIPFPPSGGDPDSLWITQKKHMEKVMGPNGHLAGWKYKPDDNAQGIFLEYDEVAHIRFFDPDDPIMGMAPLDAGRLPLLSDYKAAKYNDVFFDSGAAPGGVLYTDKSLGDKQHERLVSRLRDTHRGYKKSHRLMILEGGLKYEQTGLNQRDMEFIDLRRYSRDELLQIFGMKKSIISITDDLNYSTAREQKREWWQDVNLPIMRLITSALNFVFFRNDPKMRVAFDISNIEALQEEFKNKVDQAYKLWQMGYTAEETNQRLELGFEDAPWRKYAWIQMNMVPIIGEPKAPGQEEEGLKRLPGPVDKEIVAVAEEVSAVIGEVKDFTENMEKIRKEKIWRNFIARTDPIEGLFTKRVKRVFWEMRVKILKKLEEETKSAKGILDFYEWARLEEFMEEADLIRKYSSPIYEQAVQVGVDSFIEEVGIGINFSLSDPAVIEYLALKPNKVTGIVDTVKSQIRGVCQEGAEGGLSIPQIAEKLKGVMTMANSRAKTIARTEVVGASNFGRHAALEGSGFREKEWFTALDGKKVRESHKRLHGTSVRVGESWIFDDGSEVLYPGDWNGLGHQVINCFISPRVRIFTDIGWKKISDIKVGDLVLTHKNRFKKVLRLSARPKYNGDVIKITLKNRLDQNITVTPGHPIFMADGTWKNAEEVEVGDKIKIMGSYCARCGTSIPYWKKYCSRICLSLDITDRQWSDPKHRKLMSKKTSAQLKVEYANGTRDKIEITKKARKAVVEKYGVGGYLGKMMRENKEEFLQKGLEGMERNWGSRLNMIKKTAFKTVGKIGWTGGSSIEKKMQAFLGGQNRIYEQQFWVGRRRIDFYLPEEKLFIECDSEVYHGSFENRREHEEKRDLEILLQYPDHQIAHVWYGFKHPKWEFIDLNMLNHSGTFVQVDWEVGKIERWKLGWTRRLYNFAVEGDESYVAKGFVAHNCRCVEIAKIEDEETEPIEEGE